MNWVLILVLLTLVLCVIQGFSRGFLRIIYSLISWVIVLVFVAWSTPYINNFLLHNTTIYEKIEARCEESILQSAQEQIGDDADGKKTELSGLGVSIPDSVLDGIMEKTSGVADELLEESGLYTEIAKGMANFVMDGISFVTALIFAWLLVHIISQILGIVSHIPILKGVNQFMGIFAGALHGLLIVWIAFYVIALCSAGELGKTLISYIYESEFLTFLYENNLVLTIILKYF